jgi:uncharacterized protein with PQ loop repeat
MTYKNFSRKIRLFFFVVLFLFAIVALAYGVTRNSITVTKPKYMVLYEPAVILDATIDGLSRIDSFTFKRNYTDEDKPALCPT